MTREIRKRKAQGIFSLFNLESESSPNIVERKLGTFEGVKQVTVDYVTDTVLVDFDPETVTTDVIRSYLQELAQKGR
jgi:copper chaperone CopZ